MASSRVNVSARVRDYHTAHPAAKPQQIADRLSQRLNQPVSASYVANIISAARSSSKQQKMPLTRQLVETAIAATELVELTDIAAAQQLIRRLGGESTKQLVEVLTS